MPGRNEKIDELVARAISGDAEAWSAVLKEIGPTLEGIVRARAPRELVDDWRHEVLIRVLVNIKRFRSDSPIEHWASQIAVRTCQDLHRHQLRQKRKTPENKYDNQQLEAKKTNDYIADREIVELLLDQLEPEDRDLLIMLDIEQRSVAEIASLLNRSLSWVKVRAHRVRKRLRKWADQRGLN